MSKRQTSDSKGGGLLLLQPAFLGDVVLSTALIESWHAARPEDRISVLVRKEAVGLFEDHPLVGPIHVWDRKGWGKYPRLLSLSQACRRRAPDRVVNLHRFQSMAWLAGRVGAADVSVFEGTPGVGRSGVTAWPRSIGDGRHEIERNHAHIADVAGLFGPSVRPRLRPGPRHEREADRWPEGAMVLAPASVWATKRWPVEQWSRLADAMADRWPDLPAVLLGGTSDRPLLEAVRSHCTKADPLVCAGDLSLLSSAALMARATSVVSNDSAPLHMAGAVGCPVVGVFCSTTPSLGFGVLPDDRNREGAKTWKFR